MQYNVIMDEQTAKKDYKEQFSKWLWYKESVKMDELYNGKKVICNTCGNTKRFGDFSYMYDEAIFYKNSQMKHVCNICVATNAKRLMK